MRPLLLLPILLLTLPAPGDAQKNTTPKKSRPAKAPSTQPADPTRWPIVSFDVKGNRLYTREQIVASSGLATGSPVSAKAFEAARDRLVATGAFLQVDVGYEPAGNKQGYLARIAVTEVEPVYPLKFEDLPVPDASLKAAIVQAQPLFADRVPGSKEAVDSIQAAVSAAVRKAKPEFTDEISVALLPDNAGQLAMTIRSGKARPNIAQITFSGSKAIDIPDLQNAFAQLAIGTPFTERNVRQLLDTGIRPMFEKRGFLRVKFPKIEAAPSKRVTGVDVAITVEDGPVYKLGSTSVEGAPTGRSFEKILALQPDEVANFEQVKEAQDRLVRYFRQQGFIKAKSTFDRKIDDTKKTVDLVFTVDGGDRYTFGSMQIKGLDILTEPAIRKMWGMKSGEAFNDDYPELFLKQIKDQGVLDNLKETKAEKKIDDRNMVVDVTLYFR